MKYSKIFSLNWIDIKSAITHTILMAIMVMMINIIALGDIFKIDYHVIINTGVISGLTGFVSLLKNFLTDSDRTLAGIEVK